MGRSGNTYSPGGRSVDVVDWAGGAHGAKIDFEKGKWHVRGSSVALHIQYAHDSRQKRVGGKTAAAPNKGCSTPRMLHTADRTNARDPNTDARRVYVAYIRARPNTRRRRLQRSPANIHVHTRSGWCLFFSGHEYLFPIHVWALEGKFASSRFVRAYIPVYGCVARVPPSLLRVRVHATHVYTMPRLREWRQMMTISPIFRGV